MFLSSYIMKFCSVFASTALLVGCSGSDGNKASAERDSVVAPGELAMPAIPDSIVGTEERAAWLAAHFWDAMDFADHSRSLDSAFMEQTFANFLSVLPLTGSVGAVDRAFGNMLDKAAGDKAASEFVADVARRYMGDPNSPMRDEDLLIAFLERAVTAGSLSEATRERMKFDLEKARMNRPGAIAPDFRYMSRTGEETSLRGRHAATLLIFYDPDCPNCHEVIEDLAGAELPQNLSVLAINAEDDRDRWNETKDSMPRGWEVGMPLESLDEDRYYLPVLPVIYLLDADGRIILKDPAPAVLKDYLGPRQSH